MPKALPSGRALLLLYQGPVGASIARPLSLPLCFRIYSDTTAHSITRTAQGRRYIQNNESKNPPPNLGRIVVFQRSTLTVTISKGFTGSLKLLPETGISWISSSIRPARVTRLGVKPRVTVVLHFLL